jgi:hypothetical protein
VKRGSWSIFEDVPSVPDPRTQRPGRKRAEIPPPELGRAEGSHPLHPAVVAFVDRGGSAGGSAITTPDAIARVVADTLDLARSGEQGMAALVGLVMDASTVVIGGDDVESIDELLRSSVAEHRAGRTRGEELDRVEPGPPGGPITGSELGGESVLVRGADAVGWAFTDGGVIYDVAGGVLVRTDREGIETWRGLDGRRSVTDLVRARTAGGDEGVEQAAVHVAVALLADLAEHRLVARGVPGP